MRSNRFKISLAIVLTMCMVFCSSVYGAESVQYEQLDPDMTEEQFILTKQDACIEAIEEILPIMEDSKIGGTYFDENGNLGILVINNDVKDDIISYVEAQNQTRNPLTSSIVIKEVKYSFQELCDAMDILYPLIEADIVKSTGVISIDNKINIGVNEITDEVQSSVFALVPEDMVEFEVLPIDSRIERHVTAKSGSKINNSTMYSSIGFGGKYDGQWGFITTSHGVDQGGTVYYGADSSTPIGTVTFHWEADYYDCAFITRKDTAQHMSATSIYGDSIPYNILTPSGTTLQYGRQVKMAGYASGATRTGSVIQYPYNGSGLRGFVECSYQSIPGDSGGAVWAPGYGALGLNVGTNYSNNAIVMPLTHVPSITLGTF